MPRAYVLIFAALATGSCSAPPVPAGPPPAPEAGTTTIVVFNRVGAPFELERVAISVDGERMPTSAIPPRGETGAVSARVRVKEGGHVLDVTAAARGARRADGETAAVALHTAQGFHVGGEPATLSVDLYLASPEGGDRVGAGKAPLDPDPRLEVGFRMRGGELDPRIGATGDLGDGCQRMPPIRRAVCRGDRLAARARSERNIVLLACVSQRLDRMRALTSVLQDARRGEGDLEVAALVHDVEREVGRLEREVEQCADDSAQASSDVADLGAP